MDIKYIRFKPKKEGIINFIKFCLTGLLNTVVDFVVFSLLFSLLGVDRLPAQALGFCAGVINSFIVNRRWTFHAQTQRSERKKASFFNYTFVKFVIVNLTALGISLLLMDFLADAVFAATALSESATGYFSKVMMAPVVTLVTFFGSRFWVFRDHHKQDTRKKKA